MKQIELAGKLNKFGQGTIIDQLSFVISSNYFLVPMYLLANTLIFIFEPEKRLLIIGIMFLSLVIHFIFNELLIKRLLRPIFFIPRPFIADSKIITIGDKISDSSFPSGHMSSITAVFTTLFVYYPEIWPFAIVFLILLGFSRIHNGYHYLIDVIFGLAFGIGYGLLAIFLFNNIDVLLK